MRKTVLRMLAPCVGAVMPLSLISASWADDDDDGAARPPAPASAAPADPDDPVVVYSDQPTVEVQYEVAGSAHSADIQFIGEGGMRRFTGFVLPFDRKAKAWPPVQAVMVFATVPALDDWTFKLNGESRKAGDYHQPGGSLTCRLWVNGKLVQERSASGTNRTAKCVATVRFFD